MPTWLKNAACSALLYPSDTPTYHSFPSSVGRCADGYQGMETPRGPLNDPQGPKNDQNGPNIEIVAKASDGQRYPCPAQVGCD